MTGKNTRLVTRLVIVVTYETVARIKATCTTVDACSTETNPESYWVLPLPGTHGGVGRRPYCYGGLDIADDEFHFPGGVRRIMPYYESVQ